MKPRPKNKRPPPIVSIPRGKDYWDRLVEDIRDEESRRSEYDGRKGSRGTWAEGDRSELDPDD